MAKHNRSQLLRAVCRNCGTPTVGRYCHMCGQEVTAGTNHRLREIIGDSLGNLFSWDGKVLRTLWYLIAYPGRLTREFYAGRIVRYVFPSKLFWFITIVFFALAFGLEKTGKEAETPAWVETGESVEAVTPIVEPVEAGRSVEAVTPIVEPADTVAEKETGEETETVGQKVDDTLHTKETALMERFKSLAPYMALMLVPVFALLMWLFFRRRERAYSDYLVFSLHYNSMVFLLLSVWTVLNKVFPKVELDGWFFLWIPAIYLAIAIKKVYGTRIVPMLLKISLLGLIYLIIMLIIFVAVIVFIAVFVEKIDVTAAGTP